MWKKKTRKGDDYYSLTIKVEGDETSHYVNVFRNNKTKETQPDFKSIDETVGKKDDELPF